MANKNKKNIQNSENIETQVITDGNLILATEEIDNTIEYPKGFIHDIEIKAEDN